MTLSLGDKIRLLRTMKGYSQKGLALAAGLRQENISYVESNKNRKQVSQQLIRKIAGALNVSIEAIYEFEPVQNKQALVQQEEPGLLNSINLQKIILLQNETIQTLQQLNEGYKRQLSSLETNSLLHYG